MHLARIRWALLLGAAILALGACDLEDELLVICPDPNRQESPGVAGSVTNPLDIGASPYTGFGFYPCGYQHLRFTTGGVGTRSITVGFSGSYDIGWELYSNSAYTGTPLTACDASLTAPETCSTPSLSSTTTYFLRLISFEDNPATGETITLTPFP